MVNSNYELKIISKDQNSGGRVLKKYVIDGQETVGVVEGEPFYIQFKNKTWNRIQIRLSIDGTDIQTGSLASTSPEGTMWLVEPYGVLELKAWPETSNGGSEFMFSKVENSVAANTHGNMSGKGIIAAAVFIEGYVAPVINYNSFGGLQGKPSFRFNSNQSQSYNSNCLRSGARRSITTKGITGLDNESVRLTSSNSASDNLYLSEQTLEENLAVGAGEFVNQQIVKVAGLREPKLFTTISVKYESWNLLRSKVRALQKVVSNPVNPGFPGDAELKGINLTNVPKGKSSKSKKSSRLPDLQRF